jgi:hypothetical protein
MAPPECELEALPPESTSLVGREFASRPGRFVPRYKLERKLGRPCSWSGSSCVCLELILSLSTVASHFADGAVPIPENNYFPRKIKTGRELRSVYS